MARVTVSILLLLLLWCGWPTAALAEVRCEVESRTDLDFGVPGFPIGPVASTAQVTVSCKGKKNDGGMSALVCVGVGNNAFFQHPRAMSRQGDWWRGRLWYDIYRDAAHTEALDYRVNAAQVITLGSDGRTPVTHTFTLYGQLAAPQASPAAGEYFETVEGVIGYQPMGPGASCDNTPASENFYFTARARLAGSCLVSANDLAFGQRTILPAAGTTTIQIVCTEDTKYRVRLNQGLHAASGIRRMMRENDVAPPPEYLAYELYLDADRQLPCSPAPGETYAASGNDSAQLLLVCGRVPVQPVLRTGTYSDTVTVTVEY